MAKSPAKDIHWETKEFISAACGTLTVDQVDWATASHPERKYNCFGFAVGVLKWWQPHVFADDKTSLTRNHFWPSILPPEPTLEAYTLAARLVGFKASQLSDWDEGNETIVLYFSASREGQHKDFGHAAILRSPGVWESKVGRLSDIKHTRDALDRVIDLDTGAEVYGDGRLYMTCSRAWKKPTAEELLAMREIPPYARD